MKKTDTELAGGLLFVLFFFLLPNFLFQTHHYIAQGLLVTLSDYNLFFCTAPCSVINESEGVCVCLRGWLKIERLKDVEMKRFRGKETNSIYTVVSACSSYSCFEGESSKTVLLAHSKSRQRREKRDLKEEKWGGGMLKEAHGRQGESRAERGWKANWFIWERGREIKAENEREKRANEGINQ